MISIINKIADKIYVFLSPFAEFMSTNKYATVIRESLTIPISLTIIGSFALVLKTYLCTDIGLAQFEMFSWLADYSYIFTSINYAAISNLALVVTILIGIKLGTAEGLDKYQSMLVAVISLIIFSNQEDLSNAFSSKALFLAFIASIGSVEIFNKFMSIEKIKIKMPDSVPPVLAKTFNSLFPMVFTFIIIAIISTVLINVTGLYLNDLIYKFIQTPFANIVDSQVGATVLVLVITILWWFGLHGNTAMKAVTDPIFAINIAANMAAVSEGITATRIYTQPLQQAAIQMGGTGCVLSLAIAILLFSKRQDYKEITKASFVPLLFNISESMVFGLPIMLNAALVIPFLLAPVISINLWYMATEIGFIPAGSVYVSNLIPPVIKQFIEFGGFNGAILEVITIVIGILIYAPFIRVLDKVGQSEDMI